MSKTKLTSRKEIVAGQGRKREKEGKEKARKEGRKERKREDRREGRKGWEGCLWKCVTRIARLLRF